MVLPIELSPLVAPNQDGRDGGFSAYDDSAKFVPTRFPSTASSSSASSVSYGSAHAQDANYASIFAYTTLSDSSTSPFELFTSVSSTMPFDPPSGPQTARLSSVSPSQFPMSSPPLSASSDDDSAAAISEPTSRSVIDERAVEMANAAAWFALHQIHQQQSQSQNAFKLQPLPGITPTSTEFFSPLTLADFGMQDDCMFDATRSLTTEVDGTLTNVGRQGAGARRPRGSGPKQRANTKAKRRASEYDLGNTSSCSLSDDEPEFIPSSSSTKKRASTRRSRQASRNVDYLAMSADSFVADRPPTKFASQSRSTKSLASSSSQQQPKPVPTPLSRGAVIVPANSATLPTEIDTDATTILRTTAPALASTTGDDTQPYRSLLLSSQSVLGRWEQARLLWCLSQLRPTLLASRANLSPSDIALKELCLRRSVADIESMVRASGTPTAVWRGDAGGSLVLVGDELCELLGRGRDSLVAKDDCEGVLITDIMDGPSLIEYWESFVGIVCGAGGAKGSGAAEQWSGRCTLLRSDGLPVPCAFCCTVKRDLFGDAAIVIGNFLPVGR